MELALYDPRHGFYATGGRPGRGGSSDFITSPEVGPLFGAVFARALDQWWDEMGSPDPYTVVEGGAGTGRLAAAVLGAGPRCARALRYLLVERSPALRDLQRRHLAVEPARSVLGPRVPDDDDDAAAAPEPPRGPGGNGPVAASLAELPAGPFVGVVLANELLDNIPFRLLERRAGVWEEVRVDADLRELLVPAPPDVVAQADRWAPSAPVGARVPIQAEAGEWVRRAAGCLERGRVVVVDYADTTPSMAARSWNDWLRTYRAHGPGSGPLAELGRQDITCEIAVDQLATFRPPVSQRSQTQFLRSHGIERLVDDARREWAAGAPTGGLEAMRARSRILEAEALLDPSGLGGFRVLEWTVP